MTNSKLTLHASRIRSLDDQIEDLKIERKAAYEIAAGEGFNPAALRAAIKIARMDPAKREAHNAGQLDIETYLAELEGRELEAAA